MSLTPAPRKLVGKIKAAIIKAGYIKTMTDKSYEVSSKPNREPSINANMLQKAVGCRTGLSAVLRSGMSQDLADELTGFLKDKHNIIVK